jgi:hypothetical protein
MIWNDAVGTGDLDIADGQILNADGTVRIGTRKTDFNPITYRITALAIGAFC